MGDICTILSPLQHATHTTACCTKSGLAEESFKQQTGNSEKQTDSGTGRAERKHGQDLYMHLALPFTGAGLRGLRLQGFTALGVRV